MGKQDVGFAARATYGLGRLCAAAGRQDRAIAFYTASLARGWNAGAADRLSHILRRKSDPARAAEVSRAVAGHDPSGYFAHLGSYLEEVVHDQADEPASPDGRTCVFGDTDHRVNIGCRLTSKTFKRLIAEATDETPYGVPFLHDRDAPTAGGGGTDTLPALERLVERHHGRRGVEAAQAARRVVFQPEGRLSSGSSLETILGFFSPVALARWHGKPVLMANGTVPIYADERDRAVRAVLSLCHRHAMRDAISAEYYGSRFVPDAALAFRPDASAPKGPRDGCLVTTGARNTRDEDAAIARTALAVCRRHGLRPVMLTKHVHHFRPFRQAVLDLGGTFADTASLAVAARTVGRCRLHVGARYHGAILAADCRVPTALFDVDTQKNRWLAGAVEGIALVADEAGAQALASEWLEREPPPRPSFAIAEGVTSLLSGLDDEDVSLARADRSAIERFVAVA